MIGNTMTAARRRRKSGIFPLTMMGAAAAASGLCLCLPLAAQTTEQLVVDRHTGLAIGGFDPVAYFTEAAPMLGKSEHEYGFGGAVWRFRNEGNRQAFIADPHVYVPRFGGYDPVAIARGVGVAGNPLLWLIAGDRLYLFYAREARDAFVADGERLATTADRNWATVQLKLSP